MRNRQANVQHFSSESSTTVILPTEEAQKLQDDHPRFGGLPLASRSSWRILGVVSDVQPCENLPV